MKTNDNYICPICEKGTMRIWSERTGEPGFRMTDWYYDNQTCECEIHESDVMLSAIESFKNKEVIKKEICEICADNETTIHLSGYMNSKDICTSCFKNEILEAIKRFK